MLLPPMQIASDMLFDNFLGSSQHWSGGLVAETPTAKKKKKKKPQSLHQAHYQKPVCHSKLRHAWKGKALSDAFQ